MTRQEKLRIFARKHLLYEVEMLSGLTKRLIEVRVHDDEAGKRDLDWLDLPTRNAQVESFAVHARGLLDFLYKQVEQKNDDALGRHYAPAGWEPPEMTSSLSTVNRRVAKEIAHLTYKRNRISDEAKDWPYGMIWGDVAAVLREFVSRASPELLPKDVARKIEKMAAPTPVLPKVTHVPASATYSETSLGL